MAKSKNKEKIEELEKRIAELDHNWKRALADYANLEKRVAEEKKAIGDFANMVLLLELLPILDNLSKAAHSLKNEGLDLVLKQFKDILEKVGVKEFGRSGDHFNPEIHEALSVDDDAENEKIVEVFTPGFLLHDRLLRPARVKVGKKNDQN